MSRVCLSLFGTNEQICSAIQDHPDADLFEVRLDLSPALDGSRIRNTTNKPLLFAAHGLPQLLRQYRSFADYEDVEQANAESPQQIRSIHEGDVDPDPLWSRLQGNNFTKIVLQTDDYGKILKLMNLNRNQSPRAICFAAGEVGAFSRVLSFFWGAPWTYACLQDQPTGPGQFTLRELVDLYRLKRFKTLPKVFGIVGNPVAHSASPEFHNRKFAELNLPWIYLPFFCIDIRSLFLFAPEFGVRGFSITHPYKEGVFDLIDSASAEIHLLRSCNTVYFRKGHWVGTNTDLEGVRALIKRADVTLAGSVVVILGAGGAARAIASVVRPHVRKLIVLNRTKDRAEATAAEFDAEAGSLADLAGIQYDVLFQATSSGWNDDESPIDPAHLRKGTLVIDAIYKQDKTYLIQKAKALGCRVLNGEIWFQAQAEAQLRWWQERADQDI